jgi:hypothetical protein
MIDIYLGIAIILSLAVGLFMAGLLIARRASRRTSTLMALLAVGLVFLVAYLRRDSLFLAKILPLTNIIVLGDWLPLPVAFLAGLAWELVPGGTWRKAPLVIPFILLTLYASYGWLFQEIPASQDYWSDGVCIQTSESSCSAACAATLLRAHGIQTTEVEMAGLCFTRKSGTTMAGLYRGLKLKTKGTPWKVEVFFCDVSELRTGGYTPAILKVGIGRGGASDPKYEQDWGWSRGRPHTVVLFAFTPDDKVEIGDPSIGREHWAFDHLKVLWMGAGIKLVKR